MGRVRYQTVNFADPRVSRSGDLYVSMPNLVWAAATVGATPIALGGQQRPLIEQLWRIAIVPANVRRDPHTHRWIKTDAYERLDPSEKSAVSYFLGMTQAQLTCARLLSVPHLVHLDAVLAILGGSTRASRPDFVGFDLASLHYTVAVEAKGRTRGRTVDVTNTAKRQANEVPTVIPTAHSLRVASVAFFDNDGHWRAYLEDPVGPYESLERLPVETLLVAYYRPVVAAMLAAGVDRSGDGETRTAPLPEIDVSLGIPTAIFDVVASLPRTGSIENAQLDDVGTALRETVPGLQGKTAPEESDEGWQALGGRDAQGAMEYTGPDAVRVMLGESWSENP